MARFYGFSDRELDSMLCDDFIGYWLALEGIEGQELVNAINVSVFPDMKKSERKKIETRLNKITKFNFEDEESKIVSTEEAAKQLAKRLMGG